ncbi:MAG: class I SAM-dependent methyltransferase [Gammaproteobacteria bacterium]
MTGPPCVLHEDPDLLAVHKPAGWNTHAPSPWAGEGIYEWLRHQELRWAGLAILHRLDKDTSGVLVFGKTTLANRSLAAQFAGRTVRKRYLLLTDREPREAHFTVESRISRDGERYASGTRGDAAETRFALVEGPSALPGILAGTWLLSAEPVTGRTHQIRVHAADHGLPILGDTLYGGTAFPRVCLHAAELALDQPGSGERVTFTAPADFAADARAALRRAIIDPAATDCHRVIHGASDGWPGWYLDRLGDFHLSQSEVALSTAQRAYLAGDGAPDSLSLYHKTLSRHVRGQAPAASSPEPLAGAAAPERFPVRENGVSYELSFSEGYSVGLFLDQRDNRRRLLTGHVAAGFALELSGVEVLNTFAYTCGFSVCAALGGARTTSLDLSKKYLAWGQRNFALNGLDPAGHDFIHGDAFDWLRRLARKERRFDAVLLDPPTFSQSRDSGVFRAGKDYGKLVAAALPVLKPGGALFASTNASDVAPEAFLETVRAAISAGGRTVVNEHYVPQPPDFPVSRAEPAYLKTAWFRVGQD